MLALSLSDKFFCFGVFVFNFFIFVVYFLVLVFVNEFVIFLFFTIFINENHSHLAVSMSAMFSFHFGSRVLY